MVAVKFWACSKQSHKGRRGGRSLTGRSKEAGRRHTRIAVVAERMHRCRPLVAPEKNAYSCKHCASIWAMLLPPLNHHCASFGRPITPIERSLWRPLCDYGNPWATMAMVLLPLCLLYTTCCATNVTALFGGSMNAQGSCCSRYPETELSGF